MWEPDPDQSARWRRVQSRPPRDIVVVGGGPAAQRCVFELRKAGFDGNAVMVSAEPEPPYDRTLLSKDSLAANSPAEPFPLAPREQYDALGIDLRLSTAATALDPGAQRVTLSDGAELSYDRLVLAVGGTPVLPAALDAPGVLTLRDARDVPPLRDALERSRHIAIIGGGFIGGEIAAAAVARGAAVTLIEAAQYPLEPVLGPEVGAHVADLHSAHGVDLRCGRTARSVDEVQGEYRISLDDETTVRADSVVVGVGMRPNTDWLQGSGVAQDSGVLTDGSCRTTVPGVFAAGDCARWWHSRYGELCRVEHWESAGKHGAAAARAVLGEKQDFSPLPFFWSDQYDVKFQWVGHAPTWDEIDTEVHGKHQFVTRYFKKQELIAAFVANRPQALPALRRELLGTTAVEERASA